MNSTKHPPVNDLLMNIESKIKVGLVVDAFGGTQSKLGRGGNIYTAQLYNNLNRVGIDVTLWSYPSTIDAIETQHNHFRILNESQPTGTLPRLFRTTVDLMAHKEGLRQVDIIHATSGSSIIALDFIRRQHAKFVYDFRVPFNNNRSLLNFYKRTVFSLVQPDWVMFVDPISLQQYRNFFGRNNCSYIPIATDLEQFQPNNINSDRPPRMLFAGVLRQDKGLKDLLAAMKIVSETCPELELLIAGYGPLQGEVEEVSQLNPRIKYLGFVPNSDMPDLLNNVDLYVLPSYREGFSRSVLEAMACGLPVITTNVGGMGILQSAKAAIVTKPGQVTQLAEAITSLISDKDLRKSYSYRARSYVEKNHTWSTVTNNILALYSDILS